MDRIDTNRVTTTRVIKGLAAVAVALAALLVSARQAPAHDTGQPGGGGPAWKRQAQSGDVRLNLGYFQGYLSDGLCLGLATGGLA